MLLSAQFKTTKKRVLNWKKKFSQKLIFLNFQYTKSIKYYLCIQNRRQAESLDNHFLPPINISLKSLKLGKILKIY